MQRDKMTRRVFIGSNVALATAALLPRSSFASDSKSNSNDNGAITNTLSAAVRHIDSSRFDKALTSKCQQSLEVLSNCIYYDLRWAEDAFETDTAGRSYRHTKIK